MKFRVNIVGGGIAGSLMSRMLTYHGVPHVIIDDGDEYSASQASSNLFVASWLKKFSSEEAAQGLKWLDVFFGDNKDGVPHVSGQIDRPFATGIGAAMSVRHVAQRHLLVAPGVNDRVKLVNSDGVRLATKVTLPGPTVVCTGHRAAELVQNMPPVWVKAGHCLFFAGKLTVPSRLGLVSPYVHEKLYQFDDDRFYYADSVAVKLPVYEKRKHELMDRTKQRAWKLLGWDWPVLEERTGYRPFVTGHDFGYVGNPCQNVWVINGGGKNGMVAYANAAAKVYDQMVAQGVLK